MDAGFPIPGKMSAEGVTLAALEDAALGLYQQLADAAKNAEMIDRRAREDAADQARYYRRLVAALAAEHFEFSRLMRRLTFELEGRQCGDVPGVLQLYARSWDQRLLQLRIEVLDLTGCEVTDELTNDIEVEGFVPDPACTSTVVRETLFPLVRLNGEAIAQAKVITTVPALPQEASHEGHRS